MLDRQEPPPYRIVNEQGPAPLLIACDHAENAVPNSLNGLGLSAAHLRGHIAYDIGAKQVSLLLSKRFDAPLLLSGYSRLVIDLNRHLDDPTLILEESDGIPIPGNRNLTDEMISQRKKTFFHSYHEQYRKMAGTLFARCRHPVILSVHSFTPTMNGFDRPWEMGVLWDRNEGFAKRIIERLSKVTGFRIGENEPYPATDPEGYAQTVYGHQPGVEFALLEIRQDLIANRQGQRKISEFIHEALIPILG
ncbi:MAG: N-formylglutamate amidohydrolase [Gammaproteobacteria bacterium]|nr:N-formylglutamate amidohydrolase [Gammaproteobacteria bacterium]